MSAPRWGEPGWMPELGPGRIEFESHQALRRIVAGLVDCRGRLNPEGPRQRLTDFDRAVLAHEAAMGCPTPAR